MCINAVLQCIHVPVKDSTQLMSYEGTALPLIVRALRVTDERFQRETEVCRCVLIVLHVYAYGTLYTSCMPIMLCPI